MLTPDEIERMRREHVQHPQFGICLKCADNDLRSDPTGDWPCDAAKLLAEFERMWMAGFPAHYYGPVPHLAEVQR